MMFERKELNGSGWVEARERQAKCSPKHVKAGG